MHTRNGLWRLLALLAAIGMVLAACGDDADDGGAASSDAAGGGGGEETYRIRLPHHMAENTIDQECITEWADAVTERSDGRITFEITPAGALGGEADVEQNVFEGVFEMSYMSNVLMGVWHEPANLVSLPWLLPTVEDARTLYESDVFARMKDDFREARGARILDYCAIAERAVATNRPIQVPDDFRGVKIRVPELPVFIEAFRTLGAEPTPLPFPEVYEAMSSGIVEAVDADFSTFANLGFSQVADHFTRTGHQLTAQYLIINEEFFQSLPPDLQDILVEASRELVAGQAEERSEALAEQFADQLREAGGNVVDDLDKEPFRQATEQTRQQLGERYGIQDLLAQVEELLAA